MNSAHFDQNSRTGHEFDHSVRAREAARSGFGATSRFKIAERAFLVALQRWQPQNGPAHRVSPGGPLDGQRFLYSRRPGQELWDGERLPECCGTLPNIRADNLWPSGEPTPRFVYGSPLAEGSQGPITKSTQSRRSRTLDTSPRTRRVGDAFDLCMGTRTLPLAGAGTTDGPPGRCVRARPMASGFEAAS